jgi:hypothetical protein
MPYTKADLPCCPRGKNHAQHSQFGCGLQAWVSGAIRHSKPNSHQTAAHEISCALLAFYQGHEDAGNAELLSHDAVMAKLHAQERLSIWPANRHD